MELGMTPPPPHESLPSSYSDICYDSVFSVSALSILLSIPPTFSLATYLCFWLTCLGQAAFDAEKVSLEAVAKQLATVGLWVKSEARKTEMMCMCVNVCEAESGHHNMSLSSHTPNALRNGSYKSPLFSLMTMCK